MNLPEIEQRLRKHVAAIPPEVRPILLEVLAADEERRALEIGNLHAAGAMPETVELLIDAEEDPTLRAALVDMWGGGALGHLELPHPGKGRWPPV